MKDLLLKDEKSKPAEVTCETSINTYFNLQEGSRFGWKCYGYLVKMHVFFLFVYMYSNSKRILGNKITIITCFSIFNNFVFHISLLNMKKKPFCQIVRVKYICEIFLGYIYCNLLLSFLMQK